MGQHRYQSWRPRTTWNVSNMLQGITAQVRAARGGAAAGRHPYHLGPLSNAAAVMGPVGPAWCLPLVRGRAYTGGALLSPALSPAPSGLYQGYGAASAAVGPVVWPSWRLLTANPVAIRRRRLPMGLARRSPRYGTASGWCRGDCGNPQLGCADADGGSMAPSGCSPPWCRMRRDSDSRENMRRMQCVA